MHIYQKKKIHWLYELLSFFFLAVIVAWFFFNWQQNTTKYHLSDSWSFLFGPANFFISDYWLLFSPKDPTWYAILIASINTFILGISVMVSSTFFGLIIGFFATYPKYKMQWFSKIFVDVFRNTPLVGQLFFWYFGVFYMMPENVHSYYNGLLTVSIQSLSIYTGNLFSILSVIYFFICLYFSFVKRSLGISLMSLLMCLIYFNFSYSQYFSVSIEWLALYCTLTLYTSSYICEIVRASLLSIPISIDEAATALGLKQRDKFRYVILPIALKSMRPMLINQYITIMKNTSIGILIGYPELMNVLTGTIINATGQTFTCVLLMMLIYLSVCLFCQLLFINKNERLKY